jgi:hypothetical protein
VFLWCELYLHGVCCNRILVQSVTICKKFLWLLFLSRSSKISASRFFLLLLSFYFMTCFFFLFPLSQLPEVLFEKSLMSLDLSVTTIKVNPRGFCHVSYRIWCRVSWIIVFPYSDKGFDLNPNYLLSWNSKELSCFHFSCFPISPVIDESEPFWCFWSF